jgi:hypothetical protein
LGEIANFLAAREYARLTWGEREMRGFTPAPATLWAVSTVTGAYVEAKADGTFVAIAGSMSDAQRARGILMAAAAAAAPDAPSNPRAVLLPSASKELTLTAHVPAMSAPLGWESHAAVAGRPLFRVTRAGAADWPAAREATQRAAHLDAAAVQALSDGVPSTLVDAGDATLSSLPSAEGERTLAVRFGHMLVPANSASVLTPPVSGTWPSTEWPALPSPVFTPALPPSLIQAPLHGTSRVRRVAYRRADGARLVVKYAYPRATPEPAKAEAKDAAVEPSWVKALNDMLAKGRTMPEEKRDEDEWDTDVNEQETDGGAARKKDPFEVDLAGLRSLLGEDKAVTAPAVAKPLVLSAVLSSETGIDMHLPDRPVDARLLARASQAVPQEDVPAEIADFFAQLHAYPSAAETALSDLAALRRGTGNGAPAPKEDKEDDLFWSSEDPDADGESEFEFREFDDKFEDKSAETETETADVGKDGKKDKNGRIPPPQPVAFEVDALLPPRSVSFAGDAWYLATDEVMDVSEETRRPAVFAASVKFGAGAAVPTEEGEGEVPVEVEADAEAEIETESSSATKHVPHSILAFVNTRTVAAVDLRGPGGVVRYAEIEAPAADARALYAHLANISRDVPLGI